MENIVKDLIEQNKQLRQTVQELTGKLEKGAPERELRQLAAKVMATCKRESTTIQAELHDQWTQQTMLVSPGASIHPDGPSIVSLGEHSTTNSGSPITEPGTSTTNDVVALQNQVRKLQNMVRELQAENAVQKQKLDQLTNSNPRDLHSIGCMDVICDSMTNTQISDWMEDPPSPPQHSTVDSATIRFQCYIHSLQQRVLVSTPRESNRITCADELWLLLDAPLDPDNLEDILDLAADLYADCGCPETRGHATRGLHVQWEPFDANKMG
jgi:hypothetical protein